MKRRRDEFGPLDVQHLDPDDPLRRLFVRVVGQQKRDVLALHHSVPGNPTTAEKLNRKRFARDQVRKAQRSITGSRRIPLAKEVLAHRYRDEPVLDRIFPQRRKAWLPLVKRRRDVGQYVIDIPRLSFIDDPEGVLKAVAQIAEAEARRLDVRVNFNFEYVEDLGPFLVLSEVWPHFAPVFSGGGTMSPAVQKVIEAVDLSSTLRMAFPGLRDLDDVWAMPVQRRRARGRSHSAIRSIRPQTREAVATRLCDEIDEWLFGANAGAALSQLGRSHFCLIVGELLDNAERHSSFIDKDGSWTVAAFMARREVGGVEQYACHMAFLSLGDTISQSLNATAPPKVKKQIADFIGRQQAAGSSQSVETLMTLAALQDGITRDQEAFEEGRGGTGLMEFIDTVNMIAVSDQPHLKPKMAIVSGRSCILIKQPYLMGSRATDAEGENRRLMFNSLNSGSHPPSEAHVFDMPAEFPGTVISVAFTLDPEFYRKTFDAADPAPDTD